MRRRRGETGKPRQTGVAADRRRRAQRLQAHGSGDRRERAPERRGPGPSGAAQVLREPEPEHDRRFVSFFRFVASLGSRRSSVPLPRLAQDRAERLVDRVRSATRAQAGHVQDRRGLPARELKQGRFVLFGSARRVWAPLRVESNHRVSRQARNRAPKALRVVREDHRAARQIQGERGSRVFSLSARRRRLRRVGGAEEEGRGRGRGPGPRTEKRRTEIARLGAFGSQPGHRRSQPGVLPRERVRHFPPPLRAQPAQARLFPGPFLLRERGGEAHPAHAPLGALGGADADPYVPIEARVFVSLALGQTPHVPFALARR